MLDAATLTVNGLPLTNTNIVLYAGWNLVGYPSLNTSRTFADALVGTGYDALEGFNASSPYFLSVINDMDIMMPGHGYWVHVPSDTVWTVVNSIPTPPIQEEKEIPSPIQDEVAEPDEHEEKEVSEQSSSKQNDIGLRKENLAVPSIPSGLLFIIGLLLICVQLRLRRKDN